MASVLEGLKSVHQRIIQMYHFRRKWERYTVIVGTVMAYAQIGGTFSFLSVPEGSPELLFSKSQ